ncbi:shikimate kinase [Aquibacillus salsiterrae]|uniref:Shikimate kinase n=1 Tax=Aquibacillus salsiterrae TaxID=2950439 RepID=A0A9X3WB37_9BACI|nr:shikimate kinase [Aquibacillus salsiterrae]MDC3416195.1 shikimate kinase [Aquibacillus salsiterrae]
MQKQSLQQEKSIVLIGFMGVGKTTVGQRLADQLKRTFVDIDEEIEKEFGMPPSDIFKVHGEKAFRQKEKELIERYSRKSNKVLSLGGGAFLQTEVRDVCLENCLVVFLSLSWEQWQERVSLIIDSRPVLQGKSEEEMEQLYHDRQKIYGSHHIEVETDNKSVDDVAEEVIHKFTKM